MLKFNTKWIPWFLVLLAMLTVSIGGSVLLVLQGFILSGRWVGGVGLFLTYIWLSIGLFVRRKIPWVWWAGFIIHGTALLLLTSTALLLANFPRIAVSSFAIWCMSAAFLVGFWLIRVILTPGFVTFGIARTVIDEAIGLRVFLVPVILVISVVCILPVLLDPGERLEYRIQTFLSWAISSTAFLLSAMTVFLACATVCNEIKNKQIYLTMTKPVGRFQYIVGKWIGITLINLVLVTVMGGGIWVFTWAITTPGAISQEDASVVINRVLIARQSVQPTPMDGSFETQFKAKVEQLKAQDPNTYGPEMSNETRNTIQQQILSNWLNIPYQGDGSYRFSGLNAAKKFTDRIQLRIKADASPRPPNETLTLFVKLNGREFPAPENGYAVPIPVICNQFQVIDIPIQAADENGNLVVTLKNYSVGESQGQPVGVGVQITKGEGLEILYRVGGFDYNLFKAMLMIWFRLIFLAMAGVMAGTFLGFPVACMLSIMIFLVSTCSSFFTESLTNYVALEPDVAYSGNPIFAPLFAFKQHLIDKPDAYKAIKLVVRLFGQFFVTLVPAFSDFDPIPLLVDGREVPMIMVRDGLLKMAMAWTGVCLLIGWFIFRAKELARVIV